MSTYNKKIMLLMSAFFLLINGISYAKVRAVQARRDFEQSIAKESMVVVLFYDDRDKDLTRMYEDISKTQRYDDADVVFLKVNAARKDLKNLAELYHVTTMPTFIFFHKGKCVVERMGGAPTELVGNVSRSKLQSSIDDHFGKEIDEYIAKKEAKNKQLVAQESERWQEYFYPRDMFIKGYGIKETGPKLE